MREREREREIENVRERWREIYSWLLTSGSRKNIPLHRGPQHLVAAIVFALPFCLSLMHIFLLKILPQSR